MSNAERIAREYVKEVILDVQLGTQAAEISEYLWDNGHDCPDDDFIGDVLDKVREVAESYAHQLFDDNK